VSRNPVFGLVKVAYSPKDRVVEVVALHQWILQLAKPAHDHPRSAESMTQRIVADLSESLGVVVTVDLYLLVMPCQILHVRA